MNPIKQATPEEVYLSFSSDVNPNTTQGLLSTIGNFVQRGTKHIHLLISSPGGQVSCGINIYNTLRALPITVSTYNTSNVDSIGNVIYLAGDHRYACPHSRFMFHGVGQQVAAGRRVEEKDLNEALKSIRSDQTLIANIIAERSKIETKELLALFLEASFLTAQEAREKGIVQTVGKLSIPIGAAYHQLVFKC